MDNDIEISIFCRLCLAKEEVTRPIFEGKGNSGQTYHKIFTCLPVTLSYNDSLPKSICTNCLQKLDTLYDLWNMSVNSERQLLRWLSQNKANKSGNKNSKTVCLKPEVVHVFEDPQAIVNMIAEREENDDLSSEENGFNYAGPSYANDSSSTSSEPTTGNQRKRFRKHKRPNKFLRAAPRCGPKYEARNPLSVIKNARGKPVSKEQRLVAYNVYTQYVNKEHCKSKSISLTAASVGFSEKTVWHIVKEMEETGSLSSPSKTRNRSSIFDKLNEQQRETFCQIVEEQKNASPDQILKLDIIKNRKGKVVCSEQKQMAYNIFAKYINKDNSKSRSVQLTAKDVGISETTIWGIVKEKQETGTFASPSKKRNRSSLFDKLNDEQRETFCRIIKQQKNASLEQILLFITLKHGLVEESSTATIKNRSGKLVDYEQKLLAYELYTKYLNKNYSRTRSGLLAAKQIGFSEYTVRNIVREMNETGTLSSPSKKRNRSSIFDKLNEHQRETFCQIIEEQKYSSPDRILLVLKKNGTLPRMSKSSLLRFKRKLSLT